MFEYNSFSPLRYWGGLYHLVAFINKIDLVLVPFDIGVVYIKYLTTGDDSV